jgi:predicted DNA-binding transcriptional regulator AlpA
MPRKIEEAERAKPPLEPLARELIIKGGERLLPPGDAANFLSLSTSFLAKGRMTGRGPPFVKLGRSVRYRESALVQWLKSRTRLSTSER